MQISEYNNQYRQLYERKGGHIPRREYEQSAFGKIWENTKLSVGGVPASTNALSAATKVSSAGNDSINRREELARVMKV